MSGELSGVDLARQALTAAREAAKKNGGARKEKPKRRTGTAVRRDGRDPLGLGAAIGMMMTERGMAAPAAGGSVLAQFDGILTAAAPELAGHARAVAFDTDTGRLDVVADAPAYGTKLRWSAPKLIEAANTQVPGANVRSLNVLAPASGASAVTAAAGPDLRPTMPAGAVRTRQTASDGYHRALAAHRQAAPPSMADPYIAQAVERQARAMRDDSRHAFPDSTPEDAPAAIETTRVKRRRQAAITEAAALRRARAERAQQREEAAEIPMAKPPASVRAGA
ncbi:DciA family protein [Streptomyces sp. NPDC005811]|uniref:DciA family protein n=1 Tax=Streptomyces sp. NPDC005811 TaxID=3154565 RepID=UPI0033D5C9C1